MTKKIRTVLVVLAGVAIAAFYGASAHAQTVSQVTVVMPHDPAAYTAQLKAGQALLQDMGGTGTLRAWTATISGTATGSVAVTVEWPNMAAFAADAERIQTDPRWAAWLAGLGEIRSIVSVGLYNEINLD